MTTPVIRNVEAHSFLRQLWGHLNEAIPPVKEVPLQVEQEAREIFPTRPADQPRTSWFLEAAFVSRFITPAVHNFLKVHSQLDDESATAALISENSIDRKRGYANKKVLTAYPLRHPFVKSTGVSATEIADRWYGGRKALSSKHPDLCLTRPYQILFEAKYLRPKNTRGRTELVKSVYEAFFYRGLATINDGDRPWNYDFAVALVYDGTRDASFLRAWNDLPSEVRDAIWNAANIFVMPLRGPEA